jgi:hypothetical protein
MVNKKFWLGMLIIMLVLGMTVFGCKDEPDDEGNDTWSNVTSLNQLNGTWKGTVSSSCLVNNDGLYYDGLYDVRLTSKLDATFTINATAKTRSESMTETDTLSGGNIDDVWQELKLILQSEANRFEIPITFNDATHSYTKTSNDPAYPMTDGLITNLLNDFQINQKGTKIKGLIKLYYGPIIEWIFYKQ